MSLAATWHRIGPDLAARGWDCLAVDLPGHGASPPAPRPLDLDLFVNGVARGLGEPLELIVGHSLGGIVALALADRRPELARGIVLEDPPGYRGVDADALAAGISSDAALAGTDRGALVRREREVNPAWSEADVRYAVAGIAAAQADAVVAGLRGPLRWDLPAMLAAVEVPVLVLAAPGAPDPFPRNGGTALTGSDRAEVERLLPRERFVVLEGGHCLHRDAPGRWLEAVDGFATSVLEAGATP